MSNSTKKSVQWRDIIVGAMATLVMTVLGGIIVYYVTRGESEATPKENLIYEVEPITRFEAENTELAFTTMRLENTGRASAEDVMVGIESDARIADQKISLSSEPVGSYTLVDSNRTRRAILVPTLAPGESVSIGIVFDQIPTAGLQVGVKSQNSIGSEERIVREATPDYSEFETVFPWLIVPALVLQGAILVFLRNRLRNRPRPASVNNTAFLYLHSGLESEAHDILTRSIAIDGASTHELSNLGLCIALKGEHEKAQRIFRSADFYSKGDHEKAVLSFNKALASLLNGEITVAKEQLSKAFSLSKSEIENYCSFSIIVSKLRENPEYAKLFDEAAQESA